MKWIVKQVVGYLNHSGLLAGGVALSVILGTYALTGLAPSGPILGLAGCGTLLVYLLDRTWFAGPEDRVNKPERVAWVRRHRRGLLVTALAAGAGAGWAALLLRPETLLLAAALGLCGGAYALPVLRGNLRVKQVRHLKPVLIGLAWTVGGVWLPLVEAGRPGHAWVLPLMLYRLMYVLPNLFLADIPDWEGDGQAGAHNLADPAERDGRLRRVRALVGLGLAGGLLWAGLLKGPRLLLVDLIGLFAMLALLARPYGRPGWYYTLVNDLVVGWPLVTALAAYVMTGWGSG